MAVKWSPRQLCFSPTYWQASNSLLEPTCGADTAISLAASKFKRSCKCTSQYVFEVGEDSLHYFHWDYISFGCRGSQVLSQKCPINFPNFCELQEGPLPLYPHQSLLFLRIGWQVSSDLYDTCACFPLVPPQLRYLKGIGLFPLSNYLVSLTQAQYNTFPCHHLSWGQGIWRQEPDTLHWGWTIHKVPAWLTRRRDPARCLASLPWVAHHLLWWSLLYPTLCVLPEVWPSCWCH